jgi:hypothetical protein
MFLPDGQPARGKFVAKQRELIQQLQAIAMRPG